MLYIGRGNVAGALAQGAEYRRVNYVLPGPSRRIAGHGHATIIGAIEINKDPS